jgi:hypothetical protein
MFVYVVCALTFRILLTSCPVLGDTGILNFHFKFTSYYANCRLWLLLARQCHLAPRTLGILFSGILLYASFGFCDCFYYSQLCSREKKQNWIVALVKYCSPFLTHELSLLHLMESFPLIFYFHIQHPANLASFLWSTVTIFKIRLQSQVMVIHLTFTTISYIPFNINK